MENLTFLELAEKVLEEQKRPLSPYEIWKLAVERDHDALLKSKQGKTPAATLYSAIFTDARQNPNSLFKKIGDRPARYYLKSLALEQPQAALEQAALIDAQVPDKYSFKESQLHPFLARFAFTQFNALTKTIRHPTSNRKEFGEWVHPDMIGVYYPEWRDEVVNFSQITGGFSAKLYSFEIKKQISFSNLRESFFQAVSNSSFANEGYLVAADISDDEDFRSELRRLSSSFGIGVIRIDVEDCDSSEVLVPAREKETVDWDALNKVAMNKDVQELLRRVCNDVKTKEPRPEAFDKILEPDQLLKSITP